jgi:N-acetylmuramoyl-L-alanine amidase
VRSRKRRARGRRWRFLLLASCLLCALALYLIFFLHRGSAYAAIGDRSEFTPGACIAYSPTGSDKHLTVFVDAGHGGPDPGGTGTAPDGTLLHEKTVTLAVAADLLPLLRQDGYRVAMARTSDEPVAQLAPGALAGGTYTVQGEHADIAARVDCANAAGAQLLLSIHFNSYDDPTVGGVETLYDPDRPFDRANIRFAQLVQSAVLSGLAAKGWQVPDRGTISDTEAGTPALTPQGAAYGHLLELGPASPGWFDHPSTMPGALCEPLFLTDPGEAAVAASSSGQQALAQAFRAAIDRYFQGSHTG